VASSHPKLHGRVEGARDRCAIRGCKEPGEFKAPLEPANFDGPGSWRFLCLEHVRQHNAKYNFFQGMTPDQISDAQRPYAGWDRATRAFAHAGSDPAPSWADFSDPLEAISGRFGKSRAAAAPCRFNRGEQRALSVLGLGEDADLKAVRSSYSKLVRRFHPDRNGGDRSHESRLGEVIEAYQTLRKSAAFA
jgi:hypothetical protein